MNKQKIIDEVLEEARKKLESEFNERELKETEFKCIDTNGDVIVLNSKEVPAGTLIGDGTDWEAFRVLSFSGEAAWVTYTGMKYNHELFAEIMRGRSTLPKIIHWGVVMAFGVIYCVLALMWLGAAFMVGYCHYDCRDILGRGVSVLLALGAVVSVIEFFLLMHIGVAMIVGYR